MSNGDHSAQLSERADSTELLDPRAAVRRQIFDDALVRYRDKTKNEAGRPEGRTVPALVLGPQRYPDPSMWGPPGVSTPLTEDEEYGRAARLVEELDSRFDLDSDEPYI